jgi:hypothetical protein
VLGSQEVILPQNLIVKKGGECPNLDVSDKRIKVQLPVLGDGLVMKICLTEEVLILAEASAKVLTKSVGCSTAWGLPSVIDLILNHVSRSIRNKE